MSIVEENMCVVCLEPGGNQELDMNDLLHSSDGIYWYIVSASKSELASAVDDHEVLHRHTSTMGGDYDRYDELFVSTWEQMVSEAGYTFVRLPKNAVKMYSSLM